MTTEEVFLKEATAGDAMALECLRLLAMKQIGSDVKRMTELHDTLADSNQPAAIIKVFQQVKAGLQYPEDL